MSVRLIFHSILRGIAVDRKQADDRIASLCLMVDGSVREEFHRLTDLELVLWHVDLVCCHGASAPQPSEGGTERSADSITAGSPVILSTCPPGRNGGAFL